jgi:endo-1,4-beta-mannosidase
MIQLRKFIPFLAALFIFSNSGFSQIKDNVLIKSGSFSVGCNYWPSYSGTNMWKDWRPDIIEKDLKQLSESGIRVLRVFPLWPDFQPIYNYRSSAGRLKYVGDKDGVPVPLKGEGSSGMSEIQLQRFEEFAQLAQKYDLKLIVGLITGWMSGRLHVPPALDGVDIMADAKSLYWQQKFVTTFVNRLKDEPAIIAWDFGNECNVMDFEVDKYQAYAWMSVLAGAIRTADDTRPIVSGMHGLRSDGKNGWDIIDQAGLTDLLTTHPYYLHTAYAGLDGFNTIRTIIHGAAQCRWYSDIGGKPCLVEETGINGPMIGGEKEVADFARTAFFSNWANNCMGLFWWNGYDQFSLTQPPYTYAAKEQELGLFREDRSPKPVVKEFKSFSNFIDKLPFKTLPARKTEAVCLLSDGQDHWAVAFSSFILAKQAGFDFDYQVVGDELKDAPLYLLPSVDGTPMFKDKWYKLLDKVKQGASLYISLNNGAFPTFNEPLGIEIHENVKREGPFSFSGNILGEELSFKTGASRKFDIDVKQNKVLATETDGTPAFIEARYGKGTIYLLLCPLEDNLIKSASSFDKDSPEYYKIYEYIAKPLLEERILTKDHPFVAATEHTLNDKEKVVVLINYNPEDAVTPVKIKDGWKVSSSLYGKMPSGNSVTVKANDAVVLILKKI